MKLLILPGLVMGVCGAAFLLLGTESCAPRPALRTPVSAGGGSAATKPTLPRVEESERKPLPQESTVKEQDLKTTGSSGLTAPSSRSRENPAGVNPMVPPASSPPLPDDSSLLAKITSTTPPQRAASLRLAEEGRKLLDGGDASRALSRFERTIAIDSTNAYGYFYLAKAQYRLGRYRESLNFLDVAESRLSSEPFWLAEVHALRGENFRALGMTQKAEASYNQALRLNSGNRTAKEALSGLLGEK
jgi:hypothetical protein